MKYCIYCGKQIDDDSIFCIYCGKKLIIGNTSRVEETHEEKPITAEPVIAAPIPEPEKEPVEEKVDEPVEEKVEQPVERTEAEPDVSTAGAEQAKPEPEEEPIYYDEDYSDNTWKWILGIIVVALIGGGIWYFGFHGKTAPASITDSDSVATDSVAENVENNDAVEFHSPDLTMCGLNGKVKSVTSSLDYDIARIVSPKKLEFDSEGRITKSGEFTFSYTSGTGSWITDCGTFKFNFSRNSEGYMTTLTVKDENMFWPEDIPIKITYNANHMVTKVYFYEEEDDRGISNVKYDSDGNMLSYGDQMSNYKFKYLEFDSHHNWTKRNVICFNEAIYEGEVSTTTKTTETRKIEYY